MKLNEQSKQWALAGDLPYAGELLDQAIAELDTLDPAAEKMARAVRLSVDAPGMVVTQAVPTKESGIEIDDYTTAFATEEVAVKGGSITFSVGSSPVFLEPWGAPGKLGESALDSLFGFIPPIPIRSK